MTVAVSIDSVVERMESIIAPLAPADGVACFTRLYLAVTRGVQSRLRTATFRDPAFLARLDERFAALYFDAVRSPPSAWRPLFEARSRKGVAPLQFALAGMNAHINRDLPVALVATAKDLGVDLAGAQQQHEDYLTVNATLAVVEREVKAGYLDRRLRLVSRLLGSGRIEDVVAMWDVERARDAAWANGQALWALRGDPELAAGFVAALDRSVGLAGRGLLVPADGLASRLARRLGL